MLPVKTDAGCIRRGDKETRLKSGAVTRCCKCREVCLRRDPVTGETWEGMAHPQEPLVLQGMSQNTDDDRLKDLHRCKQKQCLEESARKRSRR